MLRPRKKPNLLNYIRIKDFAASAGVTERNIHAWLAKPKIDPEVIADVEQQLNQRIPNPAHESFDKYLKRLKTTHPKAFSQLKSNRTKCMSYGIVYKNKGYISLQGAERFLNQRQLPRVAHRPKDNLTVEAATDSLPYSKWKLYKAIFAGQIKAVIHSQTIYLDKQSLESYKLEQKSLLPLPGWVLIRDAAKEVFRSYSSLKAWLDLHKKPTRVFMHPQLNRPCRYMQCSDLEDYQRYTQKTEKHIPKKFR